MFTFSVARPHVTKGKPRNLPCLMCTSRANISWAQTKTSSTSSPRTLCSPSFCTTSPDSHPGPGLSPRPFCGSSHHLLSQTNTCKWGDSSPQQYWLLYSTVLWNIKSKDNIMHVCMAQSTKSWFRLTNPNFALCTLCTWSFHSFSEFETSILCLNTDSLR